MTNIKCSWLERGVAKWTRRKTSNSRCHYAMSRTETGEAWMHDELALQTSATGENASYTGCYASMNYRKTSLISTKSKKDTPKTFKKSLESRIVLTHLRQPVTAQASEGFQVCEQQNKHDCKISHSDAGHHVCRWCWDWKAIVHCLLSCFFFFASSLQVQMTNGNHAQGCYRQ